MRRAALGPLAGVRCSWDCGWFAKGLGQGSVSSRLRAWIGERAAGKQHACVQAGKVLTREPFVVTGRDVRRGVASDGGTMPMMAHHEAADEPRGSACRGSGKRHARVQEGEELTCEPFVVTGAEMKPMMEMVAGSNRWFQATVVRQAEHEVEVSFPRARPNS